MLETQHLK